MPNRDFRSVHLPYCLEKSESGNYVVLNRDYKPLGFRTTEFVKYEEFPIGVRFRRLTPAIVKKLSCDGSSGGLGSCCRQEQMVL